MKKALFVYNPKAGQRVVPNRIDYIIGKFLEKDILLQPYRIDKNTGTNVSGLLNSEKYEMLIISGGDGTVNSIINIMLKDKINLPVGLIPSGTCNDLARSLEVPDELMGAVRVILGGRTFDVDTGLINGEHYMINVCAGGTFADVSYSTSEEMKKNMGPFAYYMKAITEVSAIKPFTLRLKTDNEEIEEDILLFLVLNSGNAGGFNNIYRQADIKDGLMDIILVKSCLHIELASLFFKVLNGNGLPADKNVIILKSKTCFAQSNTNIYLNVDGERAGDLPVSIRCIKQNLKVFVP